jgi:hypothetical protein
MLPRFTPLTVAAAALIIMLFLLLQQHSTVNSLRADLIEAASTKALIALLAAPAMLTFHPFHVPCMSYCRALGYTIAYLEAGPK